MDRPFRLSWINRSVIGIILATFLSDVSHEMCTAVLPLYLAALGLGPAALGLMEGLADLVMSLSKLAGGVVGHHTRHKRPLASLGYLATTIATAALGLVRGAAMLVTLRGIAWAGRGFRSPLRDYLLADAVAPSHFGRAYGLERAGDMLGAVVGPLIATLLVFAGVDFRTVILWTVVPGVCAAAALYFTGQRREPPPMPTAPSAAVHGRGRLPRPYWRFLGGVLLFGMGDFSRTFLIWIAAGALGEDGAPAAGAVSIAVLLYTLHNLASTAAAYPVGHLGDRQPKLRVLTAGYVLGIATNLLLALFSGSITWLVVAIIMSGVYIAVEETIEKAVAAEMLPRELRSLGFGVLACVNAVGDMVSSLYVGLLLAAGRTELAFGIAAGCGTLGVVWLRMCRPATGTRP